MKHVVFVDKTSLFRLMERYSTKRSMEIGKLNAEIQNQAKANPAPPDGEISLRRLVVASLGAVQVTELLIPAGENT